MHKTLYKLFIELQFSYYIQSIESLSHGGCNRMFYLLDYTQCLFPLLVFERDKQYHNRKSCEGDYELTKVASWREKSIILKIRSQPFYSKSFI